jgi:type IV pilus assembly protein PilW
MPFQANTVVSKTNRQSGLSLIELMISITIGLILLATLATLFVNQTRTRTELDKANRMIDNGRYALDLLSDNLRLAGFYGEFDPGAASAALITTPPDPCSTTAADISAALPFYVQGYDAANTSSVIDLSSTTCSSSNIPTTKKAGSDILVIRRASTQTVASTAAVSDTRYLQVSLCQYETTNSYILLTAPATYNQSKKTCTAANSGPAADLRSIRVQIFFIDANNKAGDGIPTLKMTELIDRATYPAANYPTYTVGTFTPAIPLVEGIEYMQIDYGLDTDNDGVPNSYVSTTTDWSKVVSIKLNIISRNLDPTPNYTDATTYTLGTAGTVSPGGSYKRHAYTQVVRLINPAGRKE